MSVNLKYLKHVSDKLEAKDVFQSFWFLKIMSKRVSEYSFVNILVTSWGPTYHFTPMHGFSPNFPPCTRRLLLIIISGTTKHYYGTRTIIRIIVYADFFELFNKILFIFGFTYIRDKNSPTYVKQNFLFTVMNICMHVNTSDKHSIRSFEE